MPLNGGTTNSNFDIKPIFKYIKTLGYVVHYIMANKWEMINDISLLQLVRGQRIINGTELIPSSWRVFVVRSTLLK